MPRRDGRGPANEVFFAGRGMGYRNNLESERVGGRMEGRGSEFGGRKMGMRTMQGRGMGLGQCRRDFSCMEGDAPRAARRRDGSCRRGLGLRFLDEDVLEAEDREFLQGRKAFLQNQLAKIEEMLNK